MRGNTLAEETGDIISLLIKENRTVVKVNLEMNLIKPQVLTEIEKQCRLNRSEKEKQMLVKMRKELKCLRKMKVTKAYNELKAISNEIKKVTIQDDAFSAAFKAQTSSTSTTAESASTATESKLH